MGRLTSDTITTLGSGVDGSIRRVETAYDSQGNAYLLTNYDATSSGNIVTQVQRQFNGLGQLTREWQSHSGAVNTSTTPSVQYAYSEMASGANHSRLTSMTYPSGYVLTSNYSTGLNGNISRLSSLSDSTGTLESYDYLGLGSVVRRSHPQPDVGLTFLGTGPGSGGDQYVGLDSFGRVIDQNWDGASGSTDRFSYSYDRNSNRLTRGNSLNSAFSEVYTYDNLNQLLSFDRDSGARTQSWDYDALGNFDNQTTDSTTQTRTANAQNEITSISGATTPTYDANGNMTTDETGRQFVYDAWNRLKIVKDSTGNTLKTYQYDAMNRRVAEVVGSDTTDLYYSAQWQVLEEAVSGGTTARYVWSPVYVDAMVLRDRATATPGTLNERVWVQQDANFNVTAITDGSGAVLERYAYDPYGVRTVLTPSFGSRSASSYDFKHGFQGMVYDDVAGLNPQRMRWYSPTLQRWTTMDPVMFQAGDNNLYRAEDNNVVNYVDVFGLTKGGPQNIRPSFVTGKKTLEQLNEMLKNMKANGSSAQSIKDLEGWIKTKKAPGKYSNKFGKGRSGSIDIRGLVGILGTTVIIGGVYWYYDEYTGVGESGGYDLATKVGLARKLQAIVGTGELCPPVSFTMVVAGKEIHVSILDYSDNGTAYYITAYYVDTTWSFWGGTTKEVKYLIRREDNYRVFPDPSLCKDCK